MEREFPYITVIKFKLQILTPLKGQYEHFALTETVGV